IIAAGPARAATPAALAAPPTLRLMRSFLALAMLRAVAFRLGGGLVFRALCGNAIFLARLAATTAAATAGGGTILIVIVAPRMAVLMIMVVVMIMLVVLILLLLGCGGGIARREFAGDGREIAGTAFLALHIIVIHIDRRIGEDQDRHAIEIFQILDDGALLVQKIDGDFGMHAHRDLAAPLAHAFFFEHANDEKRRRFNGADKARSAADLAGRGAAFKEARPQPLTRQLHQPERADPPDLDAGAVGFEAVLHPSLNRAVVAIVVHIDEVDDDQPGKITQAELAGDF